MARTGRGGSSRGSRSEENRRTLAVIEDIVRDILGDFERRPLIRPYVAVLGATDREYCRLYAVARNRLNVLRRTLLSRPACTVIVTSWGDFPSPRDLRLHQVYCLQRLWDVHVYITQSQAQGDWLVGVSGGIGKVYDLATGKRVLLPPFEVRCVHGELRVFLANDLTDARDAIERHVMAMHVSISVKLRVVNLVERRTAALGGIPDWNLEKPRRARIRQYFQARGGKTLAGFVHFASVSRRPDTVARRRK